MPSRLSQWAPYTDEVQGGIDLGFRYMSGHFTVLVSGPPRLANLGGDAALGRAVPRGSAVDGMVFPIGLVQNVSINFGMNLARIFELGSDRALQVPGRTVPSIQLGRPMIHGPTLLRMLWAHRQDLIPPTVVAALYPNVAQATEPNPHNTKVPPGYENFHINLASDWFKTPVGLGMMMKDSNEVTMGLVYAEACYVPNYSMSVDASGLLIQEGLALSPERIVPVATQVLAQYSGRE